jgi:Lrp/AsnC family leucine-responsive transcriptional regulator
MALKLDEIDVRILQQLQLNGRITNVQLSEKVGLSPAPTLERVKKLEHAGLIQSYGALLDAEKLGLGVVVFIEVSLRLHENSDLQRFIQEMESIPEVVECYHITGEADFLLKVHAETINAYQLLVMEKLAKVRDIAKIHSKVVLATIKHHTGLPLLPAKLVGRLVNTDRDREPGDFSLDADALQGKRFTMSSTVNLPE